MNTEMIVTVIASFGVPSAITGLCFWLLKRHIDKRENAREQQDRMRIKNELLLVKSVNASIALGEATARAVQRIPDAHCNGDMSAALDYAQEVKHEQKNFLAEQGIKSLF